MSRAGCALIALIVAAMITVELLYLTYAPGAGP